MTPLVDEGYVRMPLDSVVYPIELRPPPDFRPDVPDTWPQVEGRLEYVAGRLLYMPPCGDRQCDVATDVVYVLRRWSETAKDYLVGANEAAVRLGNDTRGADAAVWRREDVGPRTGGLRTVPPVLAVEIAGRDESDSQLRPRARWYLDHGVRVVWIVLPVEREVVVLDARGEIRCRSGETLAEHVDLPGPAPAVKALFTQLDR